MTSQTRALRSPPLVSEISAAHTELMEPKMKSVAFRRRCLASPDGRAHCRTLRPPRGLCKRRGDARGAGGRAAGRLPHGALCAAAISRPRCATALGGARTGSASRAHWAIDPRICRWSARPQRPKTGATEVSRASPSLTRRSGQVTCCGIAGAKLQGLRRMRKRIASCLGDKTK